MAKQVKFGDDARSLMVEGVNTLAKDRGAGSGWICANIEPTRSRRGVFFSGARCLIRAGRLLEL